MTDQSHRLLQIGIGLLLFSSFEGFAIPHLSSPRLGLSAHTLSALQAGSAHGSATQEIAIKILAYSSAPTGLISFVFIPWGLRLTPTLKSEYVEAIEEAKKPETRTRRIDGAVKMIAAHPAKKKRGI